MTEHFRMSGMYWGITAVDLLSHLDRMDRSQIIEFVRKCQDPVSGGFSPSLGHDAHLLYTLSAVQVIDTVLHFLFIRGGGENNNAPKEWRSKRYRWSGA